MRTLRVRRLPRVRYERLARLQRRMDRIEFELERELELNQREPRSDTKTKIAQT